MKDTPLTSSKVLKLLEIKIQYFFEILSISVKLPKQAWEHDLPIFMDSEISAAPYFQSI